MGSPFRMTPGKGSTARTTGSGFASRGLVNPPPPFHTHEGGKKHAPKSESLSKKSPSYTEYSTKVENTPGTSTTTKTNSTGGSLSTSNYDDAQSKKKNLGPDFKPTAAQTAKANLEAKALKDKDKANAESNSASSSSKTVVTKPSRTKKDFSDQINSYTISASDLQKNMENKNKTRASQDAMNKVIRENIATKDSSNIADQYRKERSNASGPKAYDDEGVITRAVQKGNAAGRESLRKAGTHTKQEQKELFSSNYGQRKGKVTSDYSNKSYTGKKTKLKEGTTVYSSKVGKTAPGSKEDVGRTKVGNKKGEIEYGKANSNTGSRGSRGR